MEKLSAQRMDPAESAGAESTLSDGVAAFFKERAGRLLLVSDGRSFEKIASAVRSKRAVGAVLDGDALPLFALPEAAGVLAVGGRSVMLAARMYAAVKRVPCVLFPTESALFGVYGREKVCLRGEPCDVPLAEGRVLFDKTLFSDAAEGYAELLLCRLALFETRALRRFHGEGVAESADFGLLTDLDGLTLDKILQKNAALRRLGFVGGEGEIFAERVGRFAAFEALTKLYVAFFRNAAPLRATVPAYEARARAAGVPYSAVFIPTVGEYTRYALVLGGRRGEFLRELGLISQGLPAYRRTYRGLGGRISTAPLQELRTLPERSNGLSAVIRDLGLLEKL